jgi:hypothetical protein
MMDVILNNRSEPLTQALQLGDSQASAFSPFLLSAFSPLGDGVWPAGHQGAFAPQRIFLLPYCLGAAGSRFSVRLYGWRSVDNNNPAGLTGANSWVFVPYLLAELACIACARVGPSGTARIVKSNEAMCDTITLTHGAVGQTGEIVSNGAGTNLVAFANVELRGCRYFQFDFQQTDPVPMNCLWARA